MSYNKLSSDDPSKFDYEDISKSLRVLDKKIKEYSKSIPSNQILISKEINSIQSHLSSIFKKPRILKEDKARLLQLESQYRDLNCLFQDHKPKGFDDLAEKVDSQDSLEEFGIKERSSLAYNNSVQLKQEELQERKEDIENLQRDFIVVNELFKDTAMLAKEQGVMLNEAEKNVGNAVQRNRKRRQRTCKG